MPFSRLRQRRFSSTAVGLAPAARLRSSKVEALQATLDNPQAPPTIHQPPVFRPVEPSLVDTLAARWDAHADTVAAARGDSTSAASLGAGSSDTSGGAKVLNDTRDWLVDLHLGSDEEDDERGGRYSDVSCNSLEDAERRHQSRKSEFVYEANFTADMTHSSASSVADVSKTGAFNTHRSERRDGSSAVQLSIQQLENCDVQPCKRNSVGFQNGANAGSTVLAVPGAVELCGSTGLTTDEEDGAEYNQFDECAMMEASANGVFAGSSETGSPSSTSSANSASFPHRCASLVKRDTPVRASQNFRPGAGQFRSSSVRWSRRNNSTLTGQSDASTSNGDSVGLHESPGGCIEFGTSPSLEGINIAASTGVGVPFPSRSRHMRQSSAGATVATQHAGSFEHESSSQSVPRPRRPAFHEFESCADPLSPVQQRRVFAFDKNGAGAKEKFRRLARKISHIVPGPPVPHFASFQGSDSSPAGPISLSPNGHKVSPGDRQLVAEPGTQPVEQSWRFGRSVHERNGPSVSLTHAIGVAKPSDRETPQRQSWRSPGHGLLVSEFDDVTPTDSEKDFGRRNSFDIKDWGSRPEPHSFGGWRSQPLHGLERDTSSVGSSDCGFGEGKKTKGASSLG